METSQLQTQPEQRESVPPTDSDIHSTLDLHVTSEITTFEDEVPPQISNAPDQPSVSTERDPFPSQSLLDFLARPRIVSTLQWGIGDAAGSCLARISFPDALFASPTIWNKIQQYVYLHAGLHFSVRVNGTPFHYGQLAVIWRPACVDRTVTSPMAASGIYDSLFTVTQYPNMLVSPSSAQVVELSVPYESPLERIPIFHYSTSAPTNSAGSIRNMSSLGLLEFWILSPLKAQGLTSDPPVTVSLFANFENPQLTGYTHAQYSYAPLAPPSLPSPLLPAELRYKLAVTQAGEDQQPAGSMPLAPAATPGSRLADQAQLPVVFEPAKTSTARNAQPSYSLSLTEDTDSFPSTTVSLRDHLSIWSLLDRFQIARTSAVGSVLATYVVIPTNCQIGVVRGKVLCFNTKVSYIANLFALWRGPIEYRFDFIASKFHSTRVKIAWYPPNTTVSAENEELPDTWTRVVDVQGQISVSFTVPYLQTCPFLPYGSDTPNSSSYNGAVVVSLVNSVSYPTQNGPPVYCNVWTRAPQLELAGFLGFPRGYVPFPNSLFNGQDSLTVDDPPYFATPTTGRELDSKEVNYKKEEEKKSKQVAQAGLASITPVALDSIVFKPSFFYYLRPFYKIWITPPLLEILPRTTVAQLRVLRMNTLLDYLLPLHIGFRGSLRVATLNPNAEVLLVPRLYNQYRYGSREDKTALATQAQGHSLTASSYFPSSANSLKDVTLPCYTSLTYRPFTVFQVLNSTSSFSVPAIDVLNFSDVGTLLTLAPSSDFQFVGMAPAPITFAV